jgi:predicted GNAT superfamily acetyltransferase
MIEICSCEGIEELDACVQLQIETWGYDENDLTPRKTFLLAQKIGGQVIGAFDSEADDKSVQTLVGFAMSLPGIKQSQNGPQPYLHSHMLAVRASHCNRGIGAQLKWEQRREALSRGIRHMEWTFDPLQSTNAFLNIHRLGAISRAYLVDFYGVSSSRLQGGLPTDRLLAEWELDSPRVEAIHARLPAAVEDLQERILVPASVDRWKASDQSREQGRQQARAVQLENRQKFQAAFSQGLAVLGFTRDSEGNGVFQLGPLTQTESSPQTESIRNSAFSRECKTL